MNHFSPLPKPLGRTIEYPRREILNAIFYLNRNGCAWRNLPGDFPPYGTVSHYYHTWRRRGIWQTINDAPRRLAKDYERLPESSEAMIHIAMIRLMLARLARKQQAEQQRQQQSCQAVKVDSALAA